MAVERTLILAKPDAVERSLSGEIVARFERRGLRLRAARLLVATRALGETHYAEHREKPFFGELVDFITSGPTLAFVLEGEGAIATARKTIGATNPAAAEAGSLRGDFALAMPNNLVHGSDSPESAEREIALWFPDGLVQRLSGPVLPLVLASTSPRRRAILDQLRIPFEVVPPVYEEGSGGHPLDHAAGKARSVDGGGRPVLGVDTVVVCDDRVLGKPSGPAEAEEFLEVLSGATHEVVSGLCLRTPAWEELHSETTRVIFRRLDPRDIAHYMASGEWEGRAGAYAIQGLGANLVERIDGDYLNVVGLPAALLVRLLATRFPGTYGFG